MQADKSWLWISAIGFSFILFLANGGLGNMGKGGTPKEAEFSASCEGSTGKWVECAGKVMSIEKGSKGFRVTIRTHSGAQAFLELDAWNIGDFPIDSEVRYKVKMGPTRYFSEVVGVVQDDLEKYCTGTRWKKSLWEPLEAGRPVQIDLSKFPALGERSYKYIYIRGSSSSPSGYEIVNVELLGEFPGRPIEGCVADKNLLSTKE